MHSIRTKITAITILAILTSMLSVFAASFSTIRAENDRQSVEIMSLIGQDARNVAERRFDGIQQSVELVANLASDHMDSVVLVQSGAFGSSTQTGRDSDENLDAYLQDYCDKIQETFASIASHTHGAEAYYLVLASQISQTQHGFYYAHGGKTGFDVREPVDPRKLDPRDVEHDNWYFTAVQRGRPSWVGPYRAKAMDDVWVYSYLVPIYRAGVLIGLVGMDLSVETLVSQISAIQVYQSGFACLFDETGRVIYHPELALGTMPTPAELNFPQEVFQQESSGDRLLRYNVNGQERQMFFCTLSNGMKLIITAPSREINASWSRLSQILLIATVVVILVFTALMLFVMRIITQPLQTLTAAARRLAAADYDVELDYRGRDEVGQLTAAFVRMRDRLKQYIEDLNRRINIDDLTGLPNIRWFFNLGEEERRRIQNAGGRSVVLYFNLIGLKHFNRQFGFDEGDKLICAVADVLAKHYGMHRISRFNRDHFAVVTEEEGLEEKLGQVLSDCAFANNGRSLPVRVGIYQDSLEEVNVSVACDRAKYASDQHKGSYVSDFYYFDRSMLKQIENLRYIISHLDQALREGWIQVCYQPIIRADNGMVCDEEALSRWIDPRRGTLSPGVFIPILENARLIYKLDLYVLEQILKKMQLQQLEGVQLVPHSLNLSRADFDGCDIVEEVRRRVDQAGIDRSLITIEVTESMIGSDFDFMKQQILRFQSLGFQVWMDDFGSGYSSLDVLQDIHFDLIKFDMRFMQRFGQGEESKIILTELIRMAIGLGIETVCEGVETQEQAAFLREVGCIKLQGYYFSKAISLEEIEERSRLGTAFLRENPRESGYYESIGRVNLYDLTVVAEEDGGAELQNFFHTMPMGVIEILGDKARFVRTNQSYRAFLNRFFHFEPESLATDFSIAQPHGYNSSFMKQLRQCCDTGSRIVIDEQMPDGSTVHSLARRIGTNPVTGAVAVAVGVLSVTDAREGATYADIARALASDYYIIYCVDLNTERFIEYSSPVGGQELALERHGEHFFEDCRRSAQVRIYEQDRERFMSRFNRAHLLRELEQQGVYCVSYRVMESGKPVCANMKVTRMGPQSSRIIVGVSLAEGKCEE